MTVNKLLKKWIYHKMMCNVSVCDEDYNELMTCEYMDKEVKAFDAFIDRNGTPSLNVVVYSKKPS